MIGWLRLTNFKNFKDARLELGKLTLLVGTNASGKSNLRDALCFLNGIGRGYTLAEIIGEKYGEGGVLQWKGIRGGLAEIARHGESAFGLECGLGLRGVPFVYGIEVGLSRDGARLVQESLHHGKAAVFMTHAARGASRHIRVQPDKYPAAGWLQCDIQQPVLSQFTGHLEGTQEPLRQPAIHSIRDLRSMRFLELAPDAMRKPSVPGQTVLGDRGENLSSVLQAMCESPEMRRALTDWSRQLTPMDVADFEFVADAAGRILLTLVESDGQRTSASAASDGTLRLLGMLAALLGPKREQLIFIEEIETGLHPTRLHLLAKLLEHSARGSLRVMATTHSPQLLTMLSARSREHAHLVYRLEGTAEAHIRRIMDIPEARAVLQQQNLARLHESGWLEDAVAFADSAEART